MRKIFSIDKCFKAQFIVSKFSQKKKLNSHESFFVLRSFFVPNTNSMELVYYEGLRNSLTYCM